MADEQASGGQLPNTTPVRRLPDECQVLTQKFDIAGHEGYIMVGLYGNGMPGEVFLVMAKEGSTVSGFADAFAQAFSMALQYGAPLEVLVDKFTGVRFEPSGITKNPDIRFAKSIVDYVARWLKLRFLQPKPVEVDAGVGDEAAEYGEVPPTREPDQRPISGTTLSPGTDEAHPYLQYDDAPPCPTCGAIMFRSGTCWKCGNCGTTTGCT